MGNLKLMTSSQSEDYLLTIYELIETYGIAKLSIIAKILNVSPGSVNDELKNLERKELIVRDPYRGIKLTEEGLTYTLPIIRKHRLAEAMVFSTLKVPWKDAHNIVKKLEHGITDELALYIEQALGNIKYCPHGNPIPDKYGNIEVLNDVSLIEIKEGKKVRVTRIVFEEFETLNYLESMGIKIDEAYTIKLNTGAGILMTDQYDNRILLNSDLAGVVKVKVE